jgi:hypothetical protein
MVHEELCCEAVNWIELTEDRVHGGRGDFHEHKVL